MQTVDQRATVFIVESDADFVKHLTWLLLKAGHHAEVYRSFNAFWEATDYTRPGCVLLDATTAEMSGFELENAAAQRQVPWPIIVLGPAHDLSIVVRAIKSGAENYLEKAATDEKLISAIDEAITKDRRARCGKSVHPHQETFDQLTSRQREVLELVVQGKTTKTIARELAISPKTIEVHRGQIMRKLGFASYKELLSFLYLTS